MSSWAPLSYNHKSQMPFHSDSTSTQKRNYSHHGRKYISTISEWKGPGVHMLPVCFPPFAYWISAFPTPLLCWLNLCIYPDICFGFFSSFHSPCAYKAFPCTQAHLAGTLTSSLFWQAVNGAWALLPGPSCYLRRFCYTSLETTLPSISWLLV